MEQEPYDNKEKSSNNEEDNKTKLTHEQYTKIMEELITIYHDNYQQASSTIWEGFKNKMYNAKDIIKFAIVFKCNTIVNKTIDAKLNIFHHEYNAKTEIDEYNKKIASIIYSSYRKNFLGIKNYETGTVYTSDCGWGCMIRSSQMILAKAFYRLLKNLELPPIKYSSIKNRKETLKLELRHKCLRYFMESPIKHQENLCRKMRFEFLKVKSMSEDNSFQTLITPPFSIKTICVFGELYHKNPGEWFSDVTMPQIFNMINEYFDIIPLCSIIHFQTIVEHKEILSRCFREVDSESSISINGKTYQYVNSGIIFISVRLGINEISCEYYDSIKRMFKCNKCIGIIGGKNSSAYFFIGFNDSNFFYLDPHYAQDSTEDVNSPTYSVKEVFQLNIAKMQTAFTVGFQFRSLKEYKELIEFFMMETKEKYPIFSYTEEITSIEFDMAYNINNSSSKDDF